MGNWVTFIQENNLEFKLPMIVNVQVPSSIVAEALDRTKESEEGQGNDISLYIQEVIYVAFDTYYWYNAIKIYLQHRNVPIQMVVKKIRDLRLKYDGLLLRCLEKSDANKALGRNS